MVYDTWSCKIATKILKMFLLVMKDDIHTYQHFSLEPYSEKKCFTHHFLGWHFHVFNVSSCNGGTQCSVRNGFKRAFLHVGHHTSHTSKSAGVEGRGIPERWLLHHNLRELPHLNKHRDKLNSLYSHQFILTIKIITRYWFSSWIMLRIHKKRSTMDPI